MKKPRDFKYYLAASVALATLIVYLTCLQNGFIDWDDGPYVFANPRIHSLNAEFFRWAFFEFHSFNWHPLTWVSHAIDYALWGLNPLGHHLTSILLHAANAFLVSVLSMKLLAVHMERSTRYGQPTFLDHRTMLIAAGTTGLLFGIHPLHVESVAWVAERKDLLCALFFLLGVTAYTNYVSRQQSVGSRQATGDGKDETGWKNLLTNKPYLMSLGCFILALLSKPMAVTFPLVLLILDWHPFDRIRSWKKFLPVFVEKLPFLALSLGSSILTVFAQKSGGALELMEIVPLDVRLLVAAKALIAYLGKMLWPLNLIPFYPYPRDVSLFSFEYVSVVALVVGITAAALIVANKQKLWFSIWCYYGVTLLPVLGIVQVGAQAMADRYTYLPSLGPFLAVGLAAAWISAKVKASGKPCFIVGTSGAVIVFVLLSYLTFEQIGRWKNDIDLWSYVIQKNSKDVLFAYYKRAQAYGKRGEYTKSIEDYNTVIAWNTEQYGKVYVDRGLTYLKIGQSWLAAADLRKACELGNDFGCKALQYVVPNGPEQGMR